MDEAAYRQAYFVDPQPEPLFRFEGIRGVSLFFDAYEEAVAFYSSVLGPPNYVEGAGTRSWVIGDSWLTLFAATAGGPANAEVQLFDSKPVIVVERFDRVWREDVLYRLPQEDICQALGVPPLRKYQILILFKKTKILFIS